MARIAAATARRVNVSVRDGTTMRAMGASSSRGCLILASFAFGCVSQGIRLYDGPARPSTETASVTIDGELLEIERIVTEGGERSEAPRKPSEPLLLTPGRVSFVVRTPERISHCKPEGGQSWKLAADLRPGRAYLMDVSARVFSVRVSSTGDGCAESASIGPVQLQDKASQEKVATGEKVSPDEAATISVGKQAAAQPNPAGPMTAPASDWSRTFVGDGPVPVHVANASDSDVTMRIRNASGAVVAQVKLPAQGNATAQLPRGGLVTQLRLERSGAVSYYRGPEIEVPANAASLDLTLESASFSNLRPIDGAEFSK